MKVKSVPLVMVLVMAWCIKKFGFKPIDNSIKSSTHGQSVGFEYILEKIQTFYL